MSTQIQYRRGTAAQNDVFTGAQGEITVDTTNVTLRVHDGVAIGGTTLETKARSLVINNHANGAFSKANSANIVAQGAYDLANATTTYAGSAYGHANGAFSKANSANIVAQGAYDLANSTTTYAGSAYGHANGAFSKANSANVLAQAAYDHANTKFASAGGTISGDVNVTGNLTVTGYQVYSNTTVSLIADNIITLNAAISQADAPTSNAGIEIDRGSSTNTSILWNETTDKWTFTNDGTIYDDIAAAGRLDSAYAHSNSAYTHANSAYDKANSGYTQANTGTAHAVASFTHANSAYGHANSAYDKANTAGISLTDNTTINADTYYPTLANTQTSGSASALEVSSTKLYYNPSTGQLNATNFNSLSDQNLKKNVITLDNAIGKINKLRGVSFDWKETNIHSIGVIAQEVEQVLPEVVSTNKDGEKSVNYGNIVGLLIQAIKEQQAQIEELKSKVK